MDALELGFGCIIIGLAWYMTWFIKANLALNVQYRELEESLAHGEELLKESTALQAKMEVGE